MQRSGEGQEETKEEVGFSGSCFSRVVLWLSCSRCSSTCEPMSVEWAMEVNSSSCAACRLSRWSSRSRSSRRSSWCCFSWNTQQVSTQWERKTTTTTTTKTHHPALLSLFLELAFFLTITQTRPKRSPAWWLKWNSPQHRLCASCLPRHVQREAKHDSSSRNSPTPQTVCLMLTKACPKRSQAWQLKQKQPHTTDCVPHAYQGMSKEKPSMTAQAETAPHHRLCASCLPKCVQREAKHDSSSETAPHQSVPPILQACPKRSQA